MGCIFFRHSSRSAAGSAVGNSTETTVPHKDNNAVAMDWAVRTAANMLSVCQGPFSHANAGGYFAFGKNRTFLRLGCSVRGTGVDGLRESLADGLDPSRSIHQLVFDLSQCLVPGFRRRSFTLRFSAFSLALMEVRLMFLAVI